MKLLIRSILLAVIFSLSFTRIIISQVIPKDFIDPPHEFSIMPFWFWNDTLKDDEIVRQIADFEAHGVYGFVIHPRIGLPENVKWLSSEMIHSMNVAISEASRRKMYVILYDEGMYPSGSSSGQVVARNPEHAARGLVKIDLKPGDTVKLPEGGKLITILNRPAGGRVAIVDQPSGSMDIGAERYFQIPGQDLVWRYVEPGTKALEGQHSTMAKCASSTMLHLDLRRNANELFGAYGHNLSFSEMEWFANWCLVRGQNFLIPHAFYYSIRGPRFDERPPDVGPNSTWWNKYKQFADACRRLSWINTDSKQVCDLAILCEASFSEGIHIAGMNYGVIIIDSLSDMPQKAIPLLNKLAKKGRLIINKNSGFSSLFKGAVVYQTPDNLITAIEKRILPDLTLSTPSENIRYRHLVKGSDHYYIVFNERETDVSTKLLIPVTGKCQLLNPSSAEAINLNNEDNIHFKPHELKIIRVNNDSKLTQDK